MWGVWRRLVPCWGRWGPRWRVLLSWGPWWQSGPPSRPSTSRRKCTWSSPWRPSKGHTEPEAWPPGHRQCPENIKMQRQGKTWKITLSIRNYLRYDSQSDRDSCDNVAYGEVACVPRQPWQDGQLFLQLFLCASSPGQVWAAATHTPRITSPSSGVDLFRDGLNGDGGSQVISFLLSITRGATCTSTTHRDSIPVRLMAYAVTEGGVVYPYKTRSLKYTRHDTQIPPIYNSSPGDQGGDICNECTCIHCLLHSLSWPQWVRHWQQNRYLRGLGGDIIDIEKVSCIWCIVIGAHMMRRCPLAGRTVFTRELLNEEESCLQATAEQATKTPQRKGEGK